MVGRNADNPGFHGRVDGSQCDELIPRQAKKEGDLTIDLRTWYSPQRDKNNSETYECSQSDRYLSTNSEKSPLVAMNSPQSRSKWDMIVAAVRSVDSSTPEMPGGISCAREVSGEGVLTFSPWPECMRISIRSPMTSRSTLE